MVDTVNPPRIGIKREAASNNKQAKDKIDFLGLCQEPVFPDNLHMGHNNSAA